MKFENGGGIAEILETGQTPTIYAFRNPQAWSSWRSGKATARQFAKSRPRERAPSMLTIQSKDDEKRARTLPSGVRKTYRFG